MLSIVIHIAATQARSTARINTYVDRLPWEKEKKNEPLVEKFEAEGSQYFLLFPECETCNFIKIKYYLFQRYN